MIYGEGKCKGNWVDKYGKGIFVSRQIAYSKEIADAAPATPEVVVNGREVAYGPSKKTLDSLITIHEKDTAIFGIKLILNKEKSDFENRVIAVDFDLKKIDKRKIRFLMLQLFLVERNITTIPDKAENCDKTLKHENIARAFTSTTIRGIRKGTAYIEYPKDVNLANSSVIGFMQCMENMQILGGTNGFDFKKE